MEIETKSAIEVAIDQLGGMTAMAKSLGLTGHSTVYQWKKTQVPAEYCPRIELATNGLVRCEDLRPDVQWSVLRGTEKGVANA